MKALLCTWGLFWWAALLLAVATTAPDNLAGTILRVIIGVFLCVGVLVLAVYPVGRAVYRIVLEIAAEEEHWADG